jgi:hypothetical protein
MAWYESIYKAFIFGSAIAFIISYFTTGNNYYNSVISGYIILIMGIIMIITMLITKILETQPNGSITQIALSIIMKLGPFLLMLFIIGFTLYLLINYKTPISDGQVSTSYNTFSNITLMLIILQIYLIYTNMDKQEFKTNGDISSITTGLLYLLGVLSLITTITIYVILKYFRADGFQTLNYEKNLKFNYLL